MSIHTRKTFKTRERQRKVSDEGVVSEMVENDEGGNDCKITVPKLSLNSREQFKKYNGVWPRSGYLFTPPIAKEKKKHG